VGLLRGSDETTDGREPKPGITDIATLAAPDDVPAVDHRVVGEPFAVPDTVGLSLFRVAQEAVANVRRHAHARKAAVVVRYVEDEGRRAAEVEVTDDGRGRPGGGSGSGGFGLTGIEERAAMHGGEVEIGPRPQGGFRVRVRIPVEVS